MKTKKIIILGILSAYSCLFLSMSNVYAATPTNDTECKKFSKGLAEYGNMELTCDEIVKADAGNAKAAADKTAADAKAATDKAAADTKTAADAAAIEDAACKSASKDRFGEELSCTNYLLKLDKICKDEGYKNCAEKATAEKNLRGTGFKLNLDALTLTSGGQKSGSAIFQNKDYAKYGVIVGTILRIIDILIMLIGSLAMLTLVIAGIFMITNHGDEAWVTKGKTMMLYSILGILVALLSFAIVNVIQSALA